MKKLSLILVVLSVARVCFTQQVMHLSNGAEVTILNSTEVTLLGGITLEEGSTLTNNGTLRLKNNPVANMSNWVDNSLAGALAGTGLTIFNSSQSQNFSGPSNFYSLQMDGAGLQLNNHLLISHQLHLINGKIITGSNHVFLNNTSSSSFLNDPTNTGYANSWVNGNFRRLITANTSAYDFPVGNDTRCNLLQFINNNLEGTSQLTASIGTKQGSDDGLNVSEGGSPYVAVNDGGVWYLNPDAAPSGGNFTLQFFFNVFSGLADNEFGILRRTDASSNAADWEVPVGSSLEGLNGAGRMITDGYARRINISEFSQWGIGQFQTSLVTWYQDSDGDSYGNAEVTQQSSTQPAGYVSDATDCDDSNGAVYPGAAEVCNGIDDDCNGLTDDADPDITGQTTWYADTDGDGFGDPGVTALACNQPSGYVSNNNDCDDTNDFITVQSIWYADTDGDGYGDPVVTTLACSQPPGYVSNNDDCDDTNDAITVQSIWYADADNDGYGNTGVTVLACNQPPGYVNNDDDCNDAKGQIHPGAREVCNGVDDDCDGQTDEGCATVNVNDAEVYESEGVANLTVTLSMAINQPVKINYKTIDGTAVSSGRNKDYKGIGNGSLTIPAGQTNGIIAIGIITDNLNESDEYFNVELTKVANALPGDNSGRVTIHNGTATFITGIDKGGMKTTAVEGLEVKVFPNPSTNNFTLNVNAKTNERITMQVIDMYGRVIETRNVNANSLIRFGDRYNAGTYFVRIMQGKEHKEIKLIKLSD